MTSKTDIDDDVCKHCPSHHRGTGSTRWIPEIPHWKWSFASRDVWPSKWLDETNTTLSKSWSGMSCEIIDNWYRQQIYWTLSLRPFCFAMQTNCFSFLKFHGSLNQYLLLVLNGMHSSWWLHIMWPSTTKGHLVGEVYSEIMSKPVCKIWWLQILQIWSQFGNVIDLKIYIGPFVCC